MNLIYAFLILIGAGLIVVAYYCFSFVKKDKGITQKLIHIRFLIRWWLIGKYHCNTSPNAIKFYKALNRLFWCVVLTGLCLVVAKVMEVLKWIL